MKRYSLYAILFGALAGAALILAGSIYFSVLSQRDSLVNTAINEKIYLAETISDTLFSPAWKFRISSIPGVEEIFIGQMAKLRDTIFIRIIGSDGVVRLSSLKTEAGKATNEPDLDRAIAGQTTIAKEEIYNGETIEVVLYPAPVGAVIQVGFSLQTIKQIILKESVKNFLVGFSALSAVLLALFFILRSVIIPIRKLTRACAEIARGNLDVVISSKSRTEIGELADTFNQMAKDLKKSHSELEEAKTALEIKVWARTKELQELAQGLEDEVQKRTKEVYAKMGELERFQKLAVGRELKMIELKEKLVKFENAEQKKK